MQTTIEHKNYKGQFSVFGIIIRKVKNQKQIIVQFKCMSCVICLYFLFHAVRKIVKCQKCQKTTHGRNRYLMYAYTDPGRAGGKW